MTLKKQAKEANTMGNLMTISGIAFAVIFIAVGAHIYYEVNKKTKSDKEKYLKELFLSCWTGRHEDIPYAWFRCVQHLKRWNPDPDLIRMATIRREQSLQVKSDAWVVDENGQLVNSNGNSNDLEAA